MVDGTKTSAPVLTPNTATFADGSLLLVDGSGLNGAAALTSQGGTLNVDAGAKLLIDNITQGEYAITSGFSVSNVQGWNGDNLSTPDNLIGLVLGKDADGSMKVQATARRSSDVFRGLSLVNTMDAIWGKGLNDTESGNMGIRFLSRAVNENHLPKADTVHTVDGAAQIDLPHEGLDRSVRPPFRKRGSRTPRRRRCRTRRIPPGGNAISVFSTLLRRKRASRTETRTSFPAQPKTFLQSNNSHAAPIVSPFLKSHCKKRKEAGIHAMPAFLLNRFPRPLIHAREPSRPLRPKAGASGIRRPAPARK